MADRQIIVRPEFIVTRQSTDVLSIEDPNVTAAVRYIREHAKEPIGVEDVVKASYLSRRILEVRFKKILRRSIQHEIRRIRVNQICEMLVSTNLSVSQIGNSLGYSSIHHISQYFRSEKGMTLLEYRRKFGQKDFLSGGFCFDFVLPKT